MIPISRVCETTLGVFHHAPATALSDVLRLCVVLSALITQLFKSTYDSRMTVGDFEVLVVYFKIHLGIT